MTRDLEVWKFGERRSPMRPPFKKLPLSSRVTPDRSLSSHPRSVASRIY